jgi:SAM-dependent methyltransferase
MDTRYSAPVSENQFDENYYKSNNQEKDRAALVWYARVIKKAIPGGPSLDFGAGTGHLVKRLPMPRYALEINESAKSAIEKNSPNTVLLKNIEEAVDAKIKFKVVTALHVVEHITDHDLVHVLTQFKKILAKDGIILISTPAKNGVAHHLKGEKWLALTDETHINIKDYGDWEKLFQGLDLRILRSFADGFYDFPYGKLWHPRNIKFVFLTVFNLISSVPFLKWNYGENNVFLLKLDIEKSFKA